MALLACMIQVEGNHLELHGLPTLVCQVRMRMRDKDIAPWRIRHTITRARDSLPYNTGLLKRELSFVCARKLYSVQQHYALCGLRPPSYDLVRGRHYEHTRLLFCILSHFLGVLEHSALTALGAQARPPLLSQYQHLIYLPTCILLHYVLPANLAVYLCIA
jgi:hypothetical protein